jgi:hypothetical protein
MYSGKDPSLFIDDIVEVIIVLLLDEAEVMETEWEDWGLEESCLDYFIAKISTFVSSF